MRSNTLDAARRAYLGLVRGTVHAVNDKPKMQTVDARLMHNELLTGIEHLQHYGFRSVPLPPDQQGPKAAELIVGFLNGNRSHPVAIGTVDRRHRPTNGESGLAGLWHYLGHLFDLTTAGAVYTAGSSKLPFTVNVGTSTFKVADGKITATVGGTSVVIKDGKILLGDESASIPVMLQSGPSTLIFGKE